MKIKDKGRNQKLWSVILNNAGVHTLFNMHKRKVNVKFLIRSIKYLHDENKMLMDERRRIYKRYGNINDFGWYTNVDLCLSKKRSK